MFKQFSTTRNPSHVLMDGGSLTVPFDRLNDFYDIYVQSVKRREKIYVVEQKTERYNFFLDLDYTAKGTLALTKIKNVIGPIISLAIPEAKGMILSVSKPKPKKDLIKTGIHINCPGLVVDRSGALMLMQSVIEALNREIPETDWTKVIDSSVYNGSGFRMLWSHKCSKHKECKGLGCIVCDQTGKLIEGEYLPVYRINGNKIEELEQEIDRRVLEESSIRIPPGTPLTQLKERQPETLELCSPILPQVNSELEEFIQKYHDGQKTSKVIKLSKTKKGYAVSTDSKYCENLARAHGSNHIWFEIDENSKTICQKCFCTCVTTEGRRRGFCKDFSGRKNILPDGIYQKLFPHSNQKKKCSFLFRSY